MRKIVNIVIAVAFLSCSPEYYVERTFEQNLPEISVMLVFPDQVDAVNSKSGLDLQSVNDAIYDSVFYAADFLPYIWRDTFLMEFKKNLKKEFEQSGIRVYNDTQWSDFLTLEGPSYIINFTYLQLEERFATYTEYIYPDNTLMDKILEREPEKFYVDLMNTLTLNVWVDYQHVQDTAQKTYSFFTYSEVSDTYVSKQTEQNGVNVFKVVKDSLTLEEALQLKYRSAPEIRNNIIDFIVNQAMDKYIGVHYYRVPAYYLKYDGKGDLIRSNEVPRYNFLKVE